MSQSDSSATRAIAQGLPNFKIIAVHANHVDESLGGLLREKRTSRGLSQAELATKLQIDPELISAYESGTKRISTALLLRIAKALRVRPVRTLLSAARKAARREAIRKRPKRRFPSCRAFKKRSLASTIRRFAGQSLTWSLSWPETYKLNIGPSPDSSRLLSARGRARNLCDPCRARLATLE